MIYAQINPENICVGVSNLSSEVNAPHMILLESADESVIGKHWTGSAWEAVAPLPVPPAPLTQLEFLRRFTATERITIRASTDPIIVDFMHLVNLAQDIRLDDPDTIMGVGYLEQQGLIAEGRAEDILNG